MKLFSSKSTKHKTRHAGRHCRAGRASRAVLPLCLALLLLTGITVGGTLAFMQEDSGAVTNSFKAGKINYTLKLEPNASNANAKYQDIEVIMPTALDAKEDTNLSVTFTPNKEPALTGYTFSGWYYDAACTEEYPHVSGLDITVKYGDSHDLDSDANKVEITLYAKWTANRYTVAYDGNGATAGSMDPSTHTYDVAANLTKNAYSRTGYRFLGWSTNASASAATYTDEQQVSNLTPVNGATVQLYAIWERMDFTVTFDTQAAGVTANPASKTVTYEYPYGDLATVSRTGYTFNGWTLDREGTKPVTKDSIVGIADNHSLYAQWTPHTYTVKYDSNVDPENTSVTQPTGSTADSTHTYDVEKPLTENGFTRTGYTFIGWNTQPDGKGDSYANAEAVKNLSDTQGDTVTLYAQWGVKSYVLRYHANGGEGTMPDQVIEWDKLTKISENKFTNTTGDYKFAGWSTTPTGEVEYLENQQVVNLLESGTLDLYAVWLLNSYTVTFDYNIGSGTPPTKEVLYGEEYGVLPPYLTTKTENLFKGWYTDPVGGTRVYPGTIVNRKENHTLWAHWDPSPANDIIKDLVVHSSADDNNDGVADDIHLQFRCSSSFEKFNVPLQNLVPGQKYALTYTASNNASFGDYINGYKNARYGSYILPTATEDPGNINTAVAQDILATWDNRIEPDGNNDGSQKATNDAWLNGPWKNRTITFNATASTMYWAWEFGLMEDGPLYDYNIYDISLKPVVPKIEFANKTLLKPAAYNAQIVSWNSDDYNANFTFDGDGGCETIYYPITGLTAGSTYTITFDHEFSGPLIHDTKTNSNPTYEYGCGIMNAVPTKTGADKMASLGTWASNTFVKKTVDGNVDKVTLTFTANGPTAYWVWNMANCSDGTNITTKVHVTNFSAKHAAGGNITYYTAPSQAATLALRVEEHNIDLIWDDIDDTNMDIWYPVDEQYPVAGDSYELAFEPSEGCTMAETITVKINDVIYEVYTDGRTTEGMVAPIYNPEANILTIPAELLTQETTTVAVIASAVPAETPEPTPEVTPEPAPEVTPEPTPEVTPEPTPEVTPEPTPEVTPEPTPEVTPEPTPEVTPEPTPEVTPEPTPEVTPEPTPEVTPEPSTEPTPAELSDEETAIAVTLNLANVTTQGSTTLWPENAYSLAFAPAEGCKLPEVLTVAINGVVYPVYTDGQEHRVQTEGIPLPPAPSFNPETNTLTIPAELLMGEIESVAITVIATQPANTDGTAVSTGDAVLPPKEEDAADEGTDEEVDG